MTSLARRCITTLAATTLLTLAVSNASARSLSTSNNNIRIAWASLELGNTLNANRVRCGFTLEGSLHARTIVKGIRNLIGYLTRSDLGTCTGGSLTINRETLPWHLTYEGFTGTLPNIATIRILLIGFTFEILQEGIRCRARTSSLNNFAGILNRDGTGRITGFRVDESRRIPLTQPGGGGGLCSFASGNFIGTASVTLLGTTTPITITLI